LFCRTQRPVSNNASDRHAEVFLDPVCHSAGRYFRDPSVSVSLPLFVMIIAVAILGVVVGGCATWFGQRRWRRAARQHEADARTARSQLAELRAAPRGEAQRLALPSQGAFYGASGRDKQGATL
jgi:hypothetical protein